MTNWFIRQGGEELGPLRPSELLQKVRSGEVTRETMLRKDNSSWFSASQVGGLFEAAMRPTIEYFCPQCQREVGEPPVNCAHCGREIQQAITRITENSIRPATEPSLTSQAGRSVRHWLQKKRLSKDNKQDGKDASP